MCTMGRTIVALAGRKGSGKTQLANTLSQKINAVQLSFADDLKDLCCELLGLKINNLPKYYLAEFDKLKRKNIDINWHHTPAWREYLHEQTGIDSMDIYNTLLGRQFHSVRELLQGIGTDLIRKYKPDWHVEKVKAKIEDLPPTTPIIIDDLRFPNEKKMLEDFGAHIFFIIRPSLFVCSNHISERSLSHWDFDDDIIVNDKDVETLNSLADNYIAYWTFLSDNDLSAIRYYKRNYYEDYEKALSLMYKAPNPYDVIMDIENPLVIEDLKFFTQLNR